MAKDVDRSGAAGKKDTLKLKNKFCKLRALQGPATIADPYQIIDWVVPRGVAGGPNYEGM